MTDSGLMVVETQAILQHTSESVNPSKKDHTMQVSVIRSMKNLGQACVSASCKVDSSQLPRAMWHSMKKKAKSCQTLPCRWLCVVPVLWQPRKPFAHVSKLAGKANRHVRDTRRLTTR